MIYFKGNNTNGFGVFRGVRRTEEGWGVFGGDQTVTPQSVVDLGREALTITLMVSAPPLLAGLAVGLTISIFQAVTQIQEFTLTFIPKILAVFVATMIFLPWMLQVFLGFTTNLFIQIPTLAK